MNDLNPQAITSIFLAYTSVGLYSFALLKKFGLNKKFIITISFLSLLGHLFGSIALYYYTIWSGSDSIYYFQNATTTYYGLGYYFAFFILGYAKKYLLGESFLAAFLISGAIGFLASIYYLITYKILLGKIINDPFYNNEKFLILPSILLLCWPSYFFWSAGLIKDNFSFLAIALLLYSISINQFSLSNLFVLAFAFAIGFLVRPYLFIVVSLSLFIYLLISKQSIRTKLIMLFSIATSTFVLLPLLKLYFNMMHFPNLSLIEIGRYAVQQQEYMHTGSCFFIPTHNPVLIFFCLPYLLLGNVFLPLGIGISGKLSILSSIENLFLLCWIIFFIKNRSIWNILKNKVNILYFFTIYFLVGMSFLSLMNCNLGLAMREKMMYMPALLICIFLTYTYKKHVDKLTKL